MTSQEEDSNIQGMLRALCRKTNINETDCANVQINCGRKCLGGNWASEACGAVLKNSDDEDIKVPVVFDDGTKDVPLKCQHLALALKADQIVRDYKESHGELLQKTSNEFHAVLKWLGASSSPR